MNAAIDRTIWPAWLALAFASAWTTFLVLKYGIDLPYKDGWEWFFWYRHLINLHHSIVTARECLVSNSPDDTCIGRLYPVEHAASLRERWKKLGDLGWRSFARNQ